MAMSDIQIYFTKKKSFNEYHYVIAFGYVCQEKNTFLGSLLIYTTQKIMFRVLLEQICSKKIKLGNNYSLFLIFDNNFRNIFRI